MKDTNKSEGQKRVQQSAEEKDGTVILSEIRKGIRKPRKGLSSLVAKVVMGTGDGVKLDDLKALVDEAEGFAEQARRVFTTVSTHLSRSATPTASAASGK